MRQRKGKFIVNFRRELTLSPITKRDFVHKVGVTEAVLSTEPIRASSRIVSILNVFRQRPVGGFGQLSRLGRMHNRTAGQNGSKIRTVAGGVGDQLCR